LRALLDVLVLAFSLVTPCSLRHEKPPLSRSTRGVSARFREKTQRTGNPARVPLLAARRAALRGRSLGGRSLGGRALGGRALGGRALRSRTLGSRPFRSRALRSRPLGGRALRSRPLPGSGGTRT